MIEAEKHFVLAFHSKIKKVEVFGGAYARYTTTRIPRWLPEDMGRMKNGNNIKILGWKLNYYYRLRFGNYRVIFKKEEKQLIIIIVRIGHRKEIYFSLK